MSFTKSVRIQKNVSEVKDESLDAAIDERNKRRRNLNPLKAKPVVEAVAGPSSDQATIEMVETSTKPEGPVVLEVSDDECTEGKGEVADDEGCILVAMFKCLAMPFYCCGNKGEQGQKVETKRREIRPCEPVTFGLLF